MLYHPSSRSLKTSNSTLRPRADDFALQSDSLFSSSEGPGVCIPNILGTLRRRRWYPVVGCLIGLTLAVAYIVLATPLYTSTATIFIDTRMNQNLQTQKIVEDTPVDTSLVDSQVQILSSESIVLPVIKSLNLSHDSEFVGPPDAIGAQILWQIKTLIKSIKQSLGLDDNTIDPEYILERTAVNTFLKRLNPKREDLTYVIDVPFASEDPIKSARIANAVADAYIAANLEATYTSTKAASHWLQERLSELRVQATDADRALQNYKSTNNIVDTGRGLLDQQQLSDLNTQLITARTETAEAKARLDRIRQISGDGIPNATVTDALNNSVITKLRAQYLDTAARAADLTTRVGSQKHVAVVRLHEQMDELRKSIQGEEQRIADAYASDYEIAKARENSLTNSMYQLVGEAGTSSQAQVTMRDLESSADTYRNLYNSFLQKFQEAIQTQTIPITDTRVITRATPPLDKSSPKIVLALAGGIVLGLFMGAGAAVAQEMMGDVFRTSYEVEQAIGLRCLGILPIVKANKKSSTVVSRWDKTAWRCFGLDWRDRGICSRAAFFTFHRDTS